MAKRILIIDDIPDIREILKLTLSPAGYEVEEAADGPEGIRKAETGCPDLIIMDLAMPGMDGIETTIRLKRNPETTRIPIIAYTFQDEEWKGKALDAGMADFFSKTIPPKELRAILPKYIKATR